MFLSGEGCKDLESFLTILSRPRALENILRNLEVLENPHEGIEIIKILGHEYYEG